MTRQLALLFSLLILMVASDAAISQAEVISRGLFCL